MDPTLLLVLVFGILIYLYGLSSAGTEPERIEVIIPPRRPRISGCALFLFLVALFIVLISISG